MPIATELETEKILLQLSTPPKRYYFNADTDPGAEEAFRLKLRELNANTRNIVLDKPNDISLDSFARLQGRYVLSSSALSSLCSKLLPGLAQAVNNLAGLGLNPSDVAVSPLHSTALALKWINDIIKIRFSKIKGYSIVVDTALNRVEGIVGRKYAFLPNIELYDRANAFIATGRRRVAFSSATLVGRRLMLDYRDQSPLFQVPKARDNDGTESFYGGFHFANSETGDCSIRASAALIRQIGGTKSISEFSDGSKIAHVKGRAFNTRFADLLNRVTVKAEEAAKYCDGIKRLMQQSLGLGNSLVAHNARLKQLERRLAKAGLKSDFCSAVLKHVLVHGSYKTDKILPEQEPLTSYASRNAFDLYNALSYRARRHSPEEQELAEQAAFKLLTGTLSLT